VKRLFLLVPFLALALAQTPTEVLRKAILETFGNWSGKTFQSLNRMVYYTPEGKVGQIIRSQIYVDLAHCRLRMDFVPEGQQGATVVLVYTPKRQFLRLLDGREVRLDDRLFLEVLYIWQTGSLGAGFGFSQIEPLGEVTLPDGKAEVYRVVREKHACLPEGVLEAKTYEGKVYLREGKVVGEGYVSPVLGAESLTLYRGFREEGGVRHPLQMENYVLVGGRWVLFAKGETLESKVGLELPEKIFR